MSEHERVPVARKTLPTELAAKLAEAWDIGEWTDWSRTPHGSSNVSYFVKTTTGEYVLRQSHPLQTQARLEFEARVLQHLVAKGYPAPELVPARDGSLHVVIHGRFYIITRRIPGGQYDPTNPAHKIEAARALGLYQKLIRDLPGPHEPRPDVPVVRSLDQVAPKIFASVESAFAETLPGMPARRFAKRIGYLRECLDEMCEELAGRPALPKLVIHGSFGRSAILFEGDGLSGVVDFDRANYELRGIDLAYTVRTFSRVMDRKHEDYKIGFDLDAASSVMQAFEEVDPLSDEERDSLPTVFAGHRLRRAVNKCGNLLAKHEVAPQDERSFQKLDKIISLEARRLEWIRDFRRDLQEAMFPKA